MIHFFNWATLGLFFVYFRPFLNTVTNINGKSIDGVLGIRTRDSRMEGVD